MSEATGSPLRDRPQLDFEEVGESPQKVDPEPEQEVFRVPSVEPDMREFIILIIGIIIFAFM